MRRRVQVLLLLFIVILVGGGLTMLFLKSELALLAAKAAAPGSMLQTYPALAQTIVSAHQGVSDVYANYAGFAYCMDWLGLFHILLAIFFLKPLINPEGHDWIIHAGIIISVLITFMPFLSGSFRGIPLYWQLSDGSLGVVCLIDLWFCAKYLKELNSLRV